MNVCAVCEFGSKVRPDVCEFGSKVGLLYVSLGLR